MKKFFIGLIVMSIAVFANTIVAAPLFMDDFNNAVTSAAKYNQVQSSADTLVTYAFDYSTMGIPVAPNTTDNTTLGVRMAANLVAPTGQQAVTLHTIQSFSGNYRVKFDAWVNANGPFPGGGAGSTEYITAGVGGDGSTVNNNNLGTGGTDTGSGGWVAVNGEGQSTSQDYVVFKAGSQQFPESLQYSAANVSGVGGGMDNANAYYAPVNPLGINVADLAVQGANNGGPAQQTGSTQVGTFGFDWHEVELVVNQTDGISGGATMTWYIDNLQIAKLDVGKGSSFNTNGRVMIGYLDPFSSVSNNVDLSFGLIDNLRVIPEPSSLLLVGLGLLGALAFVRRK